MSCCWQGGRIPVVKVRLVWLGKGEVSPMENMEQLVVRDNLKRVLGNGYLGTCYY